MSHDASMSATLARRPAGVPKVATGVRGLDSVLGGGIPRGTLTLLSGGPGTGKTMLGLEFLVRSAQAGQAGILLTFEEREDALRGYAGGFGWNIPELEAAGRLAIISARIQPDAILAGDFDLRGILGILRKKTEKIQADRLLIDAPDVFLRLLGDAAKERAEMHTLYEWLRDAKLTTLLTVKDPAGSEFAHYEFLDYMADCVIHLDQRVDEQITTRRLRVIKFRGSPYGRNEYPFGISSHGVQIIPVTQTSLQHRALGECLSSGIVGLDRILDGGYRRNSCTLITGGSGTGKTTFACTFVQTATSSNERVLYLDFEESWDALVSCMHGPGIDLMPALDSGRLRFISNMPESQGIEEHLIQAYRVIDEFQPQHLVVDAISACRRMGASHAAFDFLLRLIDHAKQRGITTLLTNLTAASDTSQEITGIDLSSVIDTVIILRNNEQDGQFHRELGILKSRGRAHSHRIHPFKITSHGIEVELGDELA